jgi:ribosome maturation factor RimP
LRKQELQERARSTITPLLASLGYELVEIAFLVSHGRRTLRVFIHRRGGVTIGDCARVSKAVGAALDGEPLLSGRYYLEVSSPGAERRLRTRNEFRMFVGSKAEIRLRDKDTGYDQVKGEIEGIADDMVRIRPEEGSAIEIPFESISSANLCL